MRTCSGVERMSTEVMMQLIALDLPAPVVPATSMCGVVEIFKNTERPAMSLPTPTSSGCIAARASEDTIRSPSETNSRCAFGTSIPIADLPGIGARIRTSVAAMVYAMSFESEVTFATFTPPPSDNS